MWEAEQRLRRRREKFGGKPAEGRWSAIGDDSGGLCVAKWFVFKERMRVGWFQRKKFNPGGGRRFRVEISLGLGYFFCFSSNISKLSAPLV